MNFVKGILWFLAVSYAFGWYVILFEPQSDIALQANEETRIIIDRLLGPDPYNNR